jgi:hypothetical protein
MATAAKPAVRRDTSSPERSSDRNALEENPGAAGQPSHS